MIRALLMKTQRNQVLDAIKLAGLQPGDFQWQKIHEEEAYMVAREGIISQIIHPSTGYFFKFDLRQLGLFYATFSPGEDAPQCIEKATTWEYMLHLCKQWLTNLRREVGSPDLWAELLTGTELAKAAVAQPAQETFSKEDLKSISRGITQLKSRLLDRGIISQDQHQSVIEKLDYLEEAAKRSSRKDWLFLTIGVLFTIAVGDAPEKARELFDLAYEVLREAIAIGKDLLT